MRRDLTLSVNVEEFYELVMLPRQIRNTNVYQSRIITFRIATHLQFSTPSPNIGFNTRIDLARVISQNLGVELTWRPWERPTPLLRTLIINLVGWALGLVPVVGPILALSFSLGMQAITDPGSFSAENVLAMDPGDMADVIRSANRVRRYLKAGFANGFRPGPVHFWNPHMASAMQGSYQRAIEDKSPSGLDLSGTDETDEARNATDHSPGQNDDEQESVNDWFAMRLPNQSPTAGLDLHKILESHSGPYALAKANKEAEEMENPSPDVLQAKL